MVGTKWSVSFTGQPPLMTRIVSTPSAPVYVAQAPAGSATTANSTVQPLVGSVWTASLTGQPPILVRSVGFTTTLNGTTLVIDAGGTSVYAAGRVNSFLLRQAAGVSTSVPVYGSYNSISDAAAAGEGGFSFSLLTGPVIEDNGYLNGFYLYLYAPTPTPVCLHIAR